MEEENTLHLTNADKNNMLETAKWGKFLSIVGFVFSGLMIVIGLMVMVQPFDELPISMGAMGMIYVALSLVYIFPSLYLYRFSTQAQQGIRNGDSSICSEAYNNLRRLFFFMGILTIIMLSIYILGIFFVLIGGYMGSML